MLENINYALFALLNATPASPQWAIEMAIFIAKDLILIVPLLVVTLWLWGPAQRQMVFKLMLALTISLTVSWAIGHGLLAGMCGCLGAALIWHTFGPALYHQLQRLYRLCFSLPIRKGWVRG